MDGNDSFLNWFGGYNGFNDGGGGGHGGDGGGSDGDVPFDGGDNLHRWLQEALLIWSVFCAWSTIAVLRHVMTNSSASRTSAPAFATVSYST